MRLRDTDTSRRCRPEARHKMIAPQVTSEQVQAARDRHALQQARAWGYRPAEPGSLAAAIERLRKAAKPNPSDVYRDRTDPCESRRRTDCTNDGSSSGFRPERAGLQEAISLGPLPSISMNWMNSSEATA